MRVVNIVCFAWGEGVRGGGDVVDYVNRLYRNVCKHTTRPFRFILFADRQNAKREYNPGVTVRPLEVPAYVGCLPKLYAHSPDAGLSGRVLIIDLDTIITGNIDEMLDWDGDFISRADELKIRNGVWMSGGNVQSFEAGTTGHIWDAWTSDPEGFTLATRGWERKTIQDYVKPQTFWQREIPRSLMHVNRQMPGGDPSCPLPDAMMVIATGSLRPHRLPDGNLRSQWEAGDASLRLWLDANGTSRDRNHIEPLLDPGLRKSLRDCGVELVQDRREADAVIVQAVAREEGRLYPPELPDHDKPLIVLEKVDGSQIGRGHEGWIDDPRVIGWMKGYKPRGNAPVRLYGGRSQVAALMDKGEVETYPEGVDLCYGFGRYEKLRPLANREPKWEAERGVDYSFVGRTHYPKCAGGKALENHRLTCIDAMADLPGKVIAHSKKTSLGQYQKSLYNAKVVVSPWGYGEPCIRDYEAMLAGCVVVKPRTDYVESLIDVYRDGGPIVFCEPDWSDLKEKAELAMEMYSETAARKAARAECLIEWDDDMLARLLAGRFWKMWRKANGSALTYKPVIRKPDQPDPLDLHAVARYRRARLEYHAQARAEIGAAE